jgi:hypothetical protein
VVQPPHGEDGEDYAEDHDRLLVLVARRSMRRSYPSSLLY